MYFVKLGMTQHLPSNALRFRSFSHRWLWRQEGGLLGHIQCRYLLSVQRNGSGGQTGPKSDGHKHMLSD